MVKRKKTFRFNDNQYSQFKQVCDTSNTTITEAFEQFMEGCIETGKLVYPEKETANCEVEARILADWLGKGKLFYRGENGEEISVQGRLLCLLSRVHDESLRHLTEKTLKKSVSEKSQ